MTTDVMDKQVADSKSAVCDLCQGEGGELVYRNALLRVVRVSDPDHPAFCRVILNRHLAELTDLPPDERSSVMRTVCVVETVMRQIYAPEKMNLASLGNMTPHLHWHIIGRWPDDARFPGSVWSPVLRQTPAVLIEQCRSRDAVLATTLQEVLAQLDAGAHAAAPGH